uniref:Uncharacterized protein n=1 Tax=Rhizophora mucronata TaxID=61149 RepID=A0A2P2PWZ6_RHIMU
MHPKGSIRRFQLKHIPITSRTNTSKRTTTLITGHERPLHESCKCPHTLEGIESLI